MYITVSSLKRTLGKYIELSDLYIALPSLIFFLVMFAIPLTRIFSLVFLSAILFLLIPIRLSKKNRTYKVIWLVIKYFFKNKKYIY